MTNEKILEILIDLKKTYEDNKYLSEEREKAAKATDGELKVFVNSLCGASALPFIVEQAIRTVKTDIAEKALSAPSKSRLAICRNILRESKKNASNKAFWYANTVDSIQYIADSYRAIALKKPLPLEEKPDNVPFFDFSKLFDRRLTDGSPLEIPDRKQLERYIKVAKAEQMSIKKEFRKAVRYNFGYGLPVVNAEYLADIMDIFPDGKFYANGSSSNVYIKGSDGDGMICRMRKTEDDTEKTKL